MPFTTQLKSIIHTLELYVRVH